MSEAAERDRDIVQVLRTEGANRAFEMLVGRYEGQVYRLCYALLRERTQAEDAAQESLIRVWRALERYDGRAALSSWIYAITRNRCLSAMERRRPLDSLDELGDDAQPAWAADTPRPHGSRAQQLLGLVEGLPERWRQPLLLYYFEEHSISEVALMLGRPEGTVKTALHRARAALTQSLKGQGLHDPAYWQEDPP